MATTILQSKVNVAISSAFHMAPSKDVDSSPSRNPGPSSSRLAPSSSQLPPGPSVPEAQPKTFKRLRTSLEQSLRTATKSRLKAQAGRAVDEDGVINVTQGKGKEKATSEEQAVPKDKPKSSMLSKVSFRLAGGRDSASPVPPVPAGRKEATNLERDRDKDKVREAGFTSFLTPSLRQASMSSPTLHLPSQGYPSPYSQPFALPAASSSNVAALVSPSRDRSRRTTGLPASIKDISAPLPLSRREPRANGSSSPPPASEQKTHRPGRSLQISVPSAYDRTRSPTRRSSESPLPPETPKSRNRELTRSPDLSPPSPSPRSGYLASKRAAASATHLPLSSPPGSPTTPRATSPTRVLNYPRSPTTPTPRPIPSASTSHLPLTPSSPSSPATAARRPSIDSPRRPSVDNPRRPSVENTRRPSVEARRPSLDTQRPTGRSSPSVRAASPTTPTRPRALSPTQRNFSPTFTQSRNLNASTTSLITPSNPEQRELIRNASSVLLKEMLKPPSQVRGPSLDAMEFEEVEMRLRPLARLERVWGKSGGAASSSQVNVSGMSSSGLSAGGEERERKQFAEALRDGYVLCQLINKFHPGTVTRVDRREDGFTRTANVTRFLAACTSLGLKSEALFDRDDLIESTPESLCRVSKTVLALFAILDSPLPERSKVIQGGRAQNNPYGQGTGSRATASTPNLQRSVSPVSSPSRQKRFSPPQLPVVRSDSPNESEGSSGAGTAVASGGDKDTIGSLPSPPPRSPLRARPSIERSSIADSTRANISDSVRGSIAESFSPSIMTTARQSLASSHLTSTTDTSAFSSLLELQRSSSSQNNKFGTIRTVTTEATSLSPSDTPSAFFSVEGSGGSSVPSSPTGAEDYASRKRGLDNASNPVLKPYRERHPSETAFVDLSRVEEMDESGSSANGKYRELSASPTKRSPTENGEARSKPSNIRLGKGKWPDDFLDAFSSPASESRSALLDELEGADSLVTPLSISSPRSTPISISPPRKLAIVTNRPEGSLDPLPQFPRRPTHRSRHSVDTPGLLPKDSILRRDSSPDTPPTPRLMIRRNSSRNGPHRNGIYIPRNSDEEDMVPFPRTVSGEQNGTPPSQCVHFPSEDSPKTSVTASVAPTINKERPHPPPRGRFQSEIDGASARRRPRPSSYDELGAKPRRGRFESMVNLGGASGDASASDLMQSSADGIVRQTLVVKEDGKPATQFRLGPCIGRGQFGAVYRALNLNTGQMVAVKRIRLEGLKEEEIAQLMNEVDLVKSLSHPSIVKYEGMCRDENTLNIILEFAENGSLGQTIKAFGRLNERLVAGYVVKILEGLHYLHGSDVVHCDLKAANILTTKNGNVKLSDFGVSLNLRAMEREKDVAGTPNWMAPEVIELKGASTKSDIWSLACTVIELLTGRPPYGEIANSMSVMFRIVEDDMPPLPEGCSNLLRDFLTQCFNKDPAKRPDAETLCEHEWLKQNWAPHKDLRPQDSIPFLRRVSADMQKSEAIRYLAGIDMPDHAEKTPPEPRPRLDEVITGSPPRRRLSNDPDPISPREHSFVKTTFGKPVVCRVCLQSVKKSAVLCEQCSLIAHTKCAPNAPPTCDLRSQLLLYAQYAENGTSPGPYSHPMEIVAAMSNGTPTSPISESNFSSRPSLDLPPSPPASAIGSPHPPTAFKVFTAAFKRSRSSLNTNDSDPTSPSPQQGGPAPIRERAISHKRSVLKRNPTSKERRPPSTISSNNSSSNHHSHNHSQGASIRSSVAERSSLASRPETVRQSTISIVETDVVSMAERSDLRLSKMTSFSGVSTVGTEREEGRSEFGSMSIPGEMPREQEVKGSKSGKRDGCVVQ
ncbi:hypothetical protein EIP91_003176 [Steccherinum ochraceum]|uniref:Uncharacterized protein n=1 Tax=Steccherinum ochraceum TaxID=92696 RepID=A0A4R0RVS9_9APHY|nr:hypothetical protein EIP91_003176 [Steccherinum ochraceum]